MKKVLLALASTSALAAASPAQAAAFVQGALIGAAQFQNDFQTLGSTSTRPTNLPFSQGGITVTYVTPNSANRTWSTVLSSTNYSWYQNGGGDGYTSVSLANGGEFDAF